MCNFCEPNGLLGEENLTKPIKVESIGVGDVCELFQLEKSIGRKGESTWIIVFLTL